MFFILIVMLLTIYCLSCQTYMSDWIWDTILFIYQYNNPYPKTPHLVEKRQPLYNYMIDDGLELNCIVLITFRVIANSSVRDFEITIRKNNKRHDLHRILLASSVQSPWSVFVLFFSSFECLVKGFFCKVKIEFTFISEERLCDMRPKYIKTILIH